MAEFKIPAHVERELAYTKVIENGTKGQAAKRVQEWVSFHGFGTAVDSDFGDATARAVRDFQKAKGLAQSGRVNQETWNLLVEPLRRVVTAPSVANGAAPTKAVLTVAKQHLKEHPIEIGGANCGPWVRTYMDGNEGSAWPWCAGFVTFVMRQAYALVDRSTPIKGSFSCDSLAAQARDKGSLVSGKDLESGKVEASDFGDISIFLVRRTSTDWTHTGLAFAFEGATFSTIEGNTNDEGSREGFEVCARRRSWDKKDFIDLS